MTRTNDDREQDGRDPAEGARANVNVPMSTDDADSDPNRPAELNPSGRKRPVADERAHTPPRDEDRDPSGDADRHTPRRTTL